jgi:hypothetical protein
LTPSGNFDHFQYVQETDRVVDELALRQCGAFCAWQLDDAGVPRTARQRRLASGRWRNAGPGVWVLPSSPPTHEQRLWIALLGAGRESVVSHEAAAELHHIKNVLRGLVTLTVPHGDHPRVRNATVHQLSDVLPHHIEVVHGLTVTTIPRTVVDLAAVVGPVRLQHIVEDVAYDGLSTFVEIGECLKSVARRGKPGVRRLSLVLDSYRGGKEVARSRLERSLLEVIHQFGIPMPIPQYAFPGRQFVNGCVDFAFPDAKLVLEADGRRWHTRIRDLKRDHERDGDAAEAGWLTLRLLYEHITGDPEGSARRIRTVLDTRQAQLAS